MEGKKLNFSAPLLSVRFNRKMKETRRPHKQNSVPLYKSDGELNDVAKPAAVPFVWEHTPGRPKENESELQSLSQEQPSITPRFPPGRVFDSVKRVSGEQFVDRTIFRPQVEASPTFDEVVKVLEMDEDLGSENEADESSDEYESLSETDSFCWTCSISGIDVPYAESSRTFSVDPQTRSLLMTRFLPAAKAMIQETPQYVPRKQPAESGGLIEDKKVVSGELSPVLKRYLFNTVSRHYVYSEYEDDEYNDHGRKFGKGCGFLPRLSMRSLTPVREMKSRAQSPVSSVPEVRRMARTAHSGPLPQTHHDKRDWNDIYFKSIQNRARSRELVVNKVTGISNHQFYPSSELLNREGLSPLRRSSGGGGVSPYRNEKPRSPFHDGARFLGIPKEIKKIESDKRSSTSNVSDKSQDVAEKTLFIDSIEMQEFSRAERLIKPQTTTLSSSCSMNLLDDDQGTKGLKFDQELDQEAKSLQCTSIHPVENLQTKNENENTKEVNDNGDSSIGCINSPRPPPLPKSPSESWLWRTMPSISLRNPFASQVHTKKQGKKISTSSAKWETIVKTSHVRHHDHKRYSEELISHIQQHSKA